MGFSPKRMELACPVVKVRVDLKRYICSKSLWKKAI